MPTIKPASHGLPQASVLNPVRFSAGIERLEATLGIDGCENVRVRLVSEFATSAWRCCAKKLGDAKPATDD